VSGAFSHTHVMPAEAVIHDTLQLGSHHAKTKESSKASVGDGSKFGCRVTYIPQESPLGIAHAVKIAKPFVDGERFVLFLGDNFIRDGIVPLVRRFQEDDLNSLIILNKVKNPQDFGVAEMDGDKVIRLVEKPQEPKSDLAVIGIYMFDHHVFEAVDNIKPSARGELEITETIQYLIDTGYRVGAHRLTGWWIDTGKMEDILEANRLILETLDQRVDGRVDADSHLIGKVVIERDAEIVNSVIRGPAIIGERTRIVNSYVGPFSSIYQDCLVTDSEIEHSIVLENCRILDIHGRIEDSLIGRNVQINRSPIKPKAYKLMLGDHSRIGIP